MGGEYDYFTQNQDDLVEATRTLGNLEVIELPNAEHGFEGFGYVDESRAAVDQAMQ